jgi:hypothetical protein
VSFVQNHPEEAGNVIVYTAPEGDEVATYTRGSARLVDGEAHVALGETFRWVTNPDIGLTVHVTPIGKWSDLYVAEKSTTQLVVRSTAGAPDVAFDYHVYGLRIGFEEASVVQEKRVESFIPAMTEHRERYAERPDLRQYNALERFKRMQADVSGIDVEAIDLSASIALRDAIHEYDPATDPPVHELFGHEGLSSGHERVTPAHETPPTQRDGDRGPRATGDRPDDSAGVLIGDRPATEDPSVDPVPSAPGENLFPVSEVVEEGDVLVLDPERPGRLRRAASSADPAVVGIVNGDTLEAEGELRVPVALYGLAEVRADAGYGAILAGDLLTTSPTPGHAMIAVAPLPGTVVGKALEPLEAGTGRIEILVMPR